MNEPTEATLTDDATAAPVQPIVMQLVQQLDDTFTRWDMYRAHDRRWIVKVEQSTQSETFGSLDMAEAMREALSWRALPLAPRPQRRMVVDMFEARKTGSNWELYYDGSFMGGGIRTKRAAMECASKWAERSNVNADEWEANYSWTESQTEGVDFRWEK